MKKGIYYKKPLSVATRFSKVPARYSQIDNHATSEEPFRVAEEITAISNRVLSTSLCILIDAIFQFFFKEIVLSSNLGISVDSSKLFSIPEVI